MIKLLLVNLIKFPILPTWHVPPICYCTPRLAFSPLVVEFYILALTEPITTAWFVILSESQLHCFTGGMTSRRFHNLVSATVSIPARLTKPSLGKHSVPSQPGKGTCFTDQSRAPENVTWYVRQALRGNAWWEGEDPLKTNVTEERSAVVLRGQLRIYILSRYNLWLFRCRLMPRCLTDRTVGRVWQNSLSLCRPFQILLR